MKAGSEQSEAGTAPQGVTSFMLKVVAICGMTMNHAAYIFNGHLPFAVECVFFAAGGLTFPVMAFLLVEGYRHTSNVKKYAFRLGVFALVAQIPYGLFLATNGNVLFTLLVGLGILYAYDHVENRAVFWTLAGVGALVSLTCDWGFIGVIMILMFKVLGALGAGAKDANTEAFASSPSQNDTLPAALCTPLGAVAAPVLLVVIADGLPTLGVLIGSITTAGDWSALPFALYPLVGCTLTIPLLAQYRGQRGLSMKWFFYAYYPLHIAVLGLAQRALFGS